MNQKCEIKLNMKNILKELNKLSFLFMNYKENICKIMLINTKSLSAYVLFLQTTILKESDKRFSFLGKSKVINMEILGNNNI